MSHLRKAGLMAIAFLALTFARRATARADAILLGVCGIDAPTQCTKSVTLSSTGLLTITLVNTTTGAGSSAQFILADGFNLPAGVGIFDPAGPANFQFTTTKANFEFFDLSAFPNV